MHGITNDDVADAPRWPQFVPKLIDGLQARKVISFNAEFEVRLLKQTFEAYNMRPAYKRMVRY